MSSDSKYQPDAPLGRDDKNDLGTEYHFVALYEFIRACATPMTIGIQGDWGSGKTSAINQITRNLEETRGGSPCYPHVYVSTWKYAQFKGDEFLGPALIKGLIGTIEKKFGLEKNDRVAEAKQAIGRVLLGLSGAVSVGGISIDTNRIAETSSAKSQQLTYTDFAEVMGSFKEDFKQIVESIIALPEWKSAGRLVIFIDDLDRVPPIRALELLEAVKNFLDVENCVFVLAVDYEVVQAGMRQKLGADVQLKSGKSFFDKIIQLPFNMPQDVYEIGGYALSLLDQSGYLPAPSDNRERKVWESDIENLLSITVGRNPRSIKRVVNYAALVKIVRQKRIRKKPTDRQGKIDYQELKTLLALICMQIAWPELASHFFRNANKDLLQKLEDFEFIQTIPNYAQLEARVDDPIQLKTNISAFADLIFQWVNKNDDEVIDDDEYWRFHILMQEAELTRISYARPPLVEFLRTTVANNCRGQASYDSFREILLDSPRWTKSSELNFKSAGTRYVAMLSPRGRQLGSIVSLKSVPLVLRFARSVDEFRSELSAKPAGSELGPEQLVEIVIDPTTSTGFGDTMIDIECAGKHLPSEPQRREFLRACLDITLGH